MAFFDFLRQNPAKLNKTGIKWYNRGEWDAAIMYFDQVISIDPNNSDAWYYKAKLLDHLKKRDDALIAVNKAIALNPTNLDALGFKEGILRCSKKNYSEAISICQDMLKIDPNNLIALSGLAESYYRTANYEKSIELAKKCIKVLPSQAAPTDPRFQSTLLWAESFLSLSEEELRK